MNPLLDFSDLPRFSDIRPEHVAPAIDQLIAEGRATIERLAAQDSAPTWESFVEPLDDANERLGRAWSQVSHLNAVVNSPELRDAYNTALPKVTQYFAEQGQDVTKGILHLGPQGMTRSLIHLLQGCAARGHGLLENVGVAGRRTEQVKREAQVRLGT